MHAWVRGGELTVSMSGVMYTRGHQYKEGLPWMIRAFNMTQTESYYDAIAQAAIGAGVFKPTFDCIIPKFDVRVCR